MRRVVDVVILGIFFIGATWALDKIGFWSFASLPEPSGFIPQGLLFLGTYLFLSTFLFDPYLKLLAERRKETVEKKQRAEETNLRAEEMIQTYRKRIGEARLHAIREREALALAGEEEERQRLALARKEGEKLFLSSKETLIHEEERTRGELKPSVHSLAEEIVQTVLRGHP